LLLSIIWSTALSCELGCSMKVGASTMISPSMPAPSLWLSPAPSTPSRRAGGAAGATIRPGGAKLGFWLGLCVGLLSVMALLATSEHQVADGGKKRGSGSGTSRRGTSSVSGNPPPQHEGTALRATLRKESLQDAPSCVHTFGQLELMNAVRWSAGVVLVLSAGRLY
jgi:hypothetical protein